jgi:hypothetical protein
MSRNTIIVLIYGRYKLSGAADVGSADIHDAKCVCWEQFTSMESFVLMSHRCRIEYTYRIET